MTIECYYIRCPYHEIHTPGPDQGPFCMMSECGMPGYLEFERWLELSYDELRIEIAEQGFDRELDFNFDSFAEKKYEEFMRSKS